MKVEASFFFSSVVQKVQLNNSYSPLISDGDVQYVNFLRFEFVNSLYYYVKYCILVLKEWTEIYGAASRNIQS